MSATQTFAPASIGAYIELDLARALALHGYGISLFADAETDFGHVCQRLGLVPAHLSALLEQQAKMQAPYFPAHEMPIRLVVEYLRHAHHLFIRERLPFLMYLVGGLDQEQGPEQPIAQDLRMIFPLFAEEFIAHIHEEEDTLFTYIADLLAFAKRGQNPGGLWLQMNRRAIGNFASDHQVHDDEMAGIRRLTDNYAVRAGMSLPLRVLFFELARFEQDLAAHAALENHILMPKALKLEMYARSCLAGLAGKN